MRLLQTVGRCDPLPDTVDHESTRANIVRVPLGARSRWRVTLAARWSVSQLSVYSLIVSRQGRRKRDHENRDG